MAFAQNLDYLMRSKGLSNYRLSKDLPCHQSTVANWLSGETEPHTNMQMQIATYFGVSVGELMGDEIPEKNEEFHPKDKTVDPVRKQLYDMIDKMSAGKLMLLLEKAREIEKF